MKQINGKPLATIIIAYAVFFVLVLAGIGVAYTIMWLALAQTI